MQFQISPVAQIASSISILASWHHQQWQHLNDPIYDLKARIADYRNIANANQYPAMFVAHQNSRPLGSIRLVENDMETHSELSPWLASLYVHQDYRRNGIGTALIRTIEIVTSELKFKTIYLFTEDKSFLYEKMGWQVHCNEIYYNQATTIMKKILN